MQRSTQAQAEDRPDAATSGSPVQRSMTARRTASPRRIQRSEEDQTSIIGAGAHKLSRIEIDAIVTALEDRILDDLARRGGRYLGQF